MSVIVGRTVIVDCQADGFPSSRIEWRLSQGENIIIHISLIFIPVISYCITLASFKIVAKEPFARLSYKSLLFSRRAKVQLEETSGRAENKRCLH